MLTFLCFFSSWSLAFSRLFGDHLCFIRNGVCSICRSDHGGVRTLSLLIMQERTKNVIFLFGCLATPKLVRYAIMFLPRNQRIIPPKNRVGSVDILINLINVVKIELCCTLLKMKVIKEEVFCIFKFQNLLKMLQIEQKPTVSLRNNFRIQTKTMRLCEIFFYQSRQLLNNYLQLVDQTFCCLLINPY